MSGTRWQWRDSGSASGHMQRVADSGTYHRVQTAYRAFLTHATGCGDCEHGAKRCTKADELWRAYRAAQT